MTGTGGILLTSVITVVAGVLIFVTGQLVLHFLIKPMADQREAIGKAADTLIFYANIYVNPGVASKEKADEAAEALRQTAALLRVRTHAVPGYSQLESLGLVVRRDSIDVAARAFMGLSNSVHKGDPTENYGWQQQIKETLSLPEI